MSIFKKLVKLLVFYAFLGILWSIYQTVFFGILDVSMNCVKYFA